MELNDSLGYLVNISARLMKRDLDNRLKEFQITTTQWSVMKVLKSYGELTQKEITEKLDSDQATGGAMIDRMIKANLLCKRLHNKDRRAYLVELTEYGKSIVNELEELAKCTNEKALQEINTKDQEKLNELLHQIIKNMKEG